MTEAKTPHRTRLATFLFSNSIHVADLSRAAGYSRQHVSNVKHARVQPTLECIAKIRAAISGLLDRDVDVRELFDFSGSGLEVSDSTTSVATGSCS